MQKVNLRRRGAVGESIAAAFLGEHGVRILERNFRSGRSGEIDIIGYEGNVLVFFEVKARRGTKSGMPEESVTWEKQKNICRTADYYRFLHRLSWELAVRFDVVGVELGDKTAHVHWIRNAFPYHR